MTTTLMPTNMNVHWVGNGPKAVTPQMAMPTWNREQRRWVAWQTGFVFLSLWRTGTYRLLWVEMHHPIRMRPGEIFVPAQSNLKLFNSLALDMIEDGDVPADLLTESEVVAVEVVD